MTAPVPPRPSAPAGRAPSELAEAAELSDEARALAAPGVAPRDYVARLVEGEHFRDAVRFLAHAIPKREAVWWAWVCARRAAGAEPPAPVRAALDATERWVAPPELVTAKAVAGAVTLSAVIAEPEKAPEKFRAFIDQGLDVVRRIRLWD